ncbi:hypothetical protein L1049_007655 [Liquidambar formosana]|uniref:Uncharacterized protein n=1 Tax=Liquidambar formosana TaxID=63359 RepID=A0AAP0S270_LIQFO
MSQPLRVGYVNPLSTISSAMFSIIPWTYFILATSTYSLFGTLPLKCLNKFLTSWGWLHESFFTIQLYLGLYLPLNHVITSSLTASTYFYFLFFHFVPSVCPCSTSKIPFVEGNGPSWC